MSRSFRHPFYKDGYGSKKKGATKAEYNGRIRKTEDVPDGKAYRKYSESWDISDYRFRLHCRTGNHHFFGKEDGGMCAVFRKRRTARRFRHSE